MIYKIANSEYHLSYSDLRELYLQYCGLSDMQFMAKLPEITHFACAVSYLKEIPLEHVVGDQGIVHELVHLMHIPDGNTRTLKEIRKLFKLQLKLS